MERLLRGTIAAMVNEDVCVCERKKGERKKEKVKPPQKNIKKKKKLAKFKFNQCIKLVIEQQAFECIASLCCWWCFV